MNVGALGMGNILKSALQAQNVSAKAMQVAQDEIEVVPVDEAASAGVDAKSARAAIDKQLADDVASGKLSQEDADKIGKALDEIDGTAEDAEPADQAAPSQAKPAGGGGGGGSEEKTELMRTQTVSGGIKTTTITYTDGTTDTQTTVDVAAQDSDDASKADQTGLSDYLSTIPPGSTFNAYA